MSDAPRGNGAPSAPDSERSGSAARTGRHVFHVGAAILFSRIVGLIRQRVFAHYFGISAAGDAYSAAFRIPNFLQNIFGEGALSASYIPVYSNLLARGEKEQASRVANTVFALLALATSAIVLVGVLAAPYLVDVIAGGFEGETRALTIRLVRIFFPGAGLLVMSAWCLGVLNSHHRFFVSYSAPVAWNIAMITALILCGPRMELTPLAVATAWGSVIGSALQFGVQIPFVLGLTGAIRPVLDTANAHVRTVVRNFFPVLVSRGIVQISGFIDMMLASFLPTGAVNALNYAQSLYTLPVSLFGISVSAVELSTMSQALGGEEQIARTLRERLFTGSRRLTFYIVPSSMAFLALGDVIAAVLYQSGRFHHEDALYVWGILAGSAVGLLASTRGRLYSSAYFALRDTRTPLRFAMIRVALTVGLGWFCALPLPPLLGLDPKWGVAGLTASAGFAGWIEYVLLRSRLARRIGSPESMASYTARLWFSAAAGAAVAWGLKLLFPAAHPLPMAVIVLGGYGLTYFAVSTLLGITEARDLVMRLLRPLRRS
jgi:putative peptidoglycan lipid II flippase